MRGLRVRGLRGMQFVLLDSVEYDNNVPVQQCERILCQVSQHGVPAQSLLPFASRVAHQHKRLFGQMALRCHLTDDCSH